MADTTIRIKNSTVAGKVPADSSLEAAELAVNLADHVLYCKDHNGEVFEIGTPGEVPSGGIGDRPSGPEVGDLYYDTDLNALLYWNGSEWIQITSQPIDPGGESAYVEVIGDNMTGDLTLGASTSAIKTTIGVDGSADFTGGVLSKRDNGTDAAFAARTSAASDNAIELNADGSATFNNGICQRLLGIIRWWKQWRFVS